MGLDAAGVGIHGTDAPDVDRLQRLTRLHPDAGARGGVAVRARPRRDARRHSLRAARRRDRSAATIAPASATRPPRIRRGWPDSRTVSAKPARAGSGRRRRARRRRRTPAAARSQRSQLEAASENVHYHGIVPDALPAPDANYTSGDDYVVEFLGYRFSFSADRLRGPRRRGGREARASSRRPSSTRRRSPTSSRSPRRA